MKLSLLSLALAVALPLGAQAQTSPQPLQLPEPLKDAARKAVVSNPDVQAKWNAFKASEGDRKAVQAGYFPQIDATVGTGRERTNHPDIHEDYGWYSHNGVSFTLNQMLFDGLFTPNEVKRYGHIRLVRYYELVDSAENTALAAMQAYADVSRYRELVEQAKANYVEHKLIFNQIAERASGGVGRRVDLEQANGRLALAESNLLTEASNLYDVSSRYLRVIGELPPESLPGLAENFTLSSKLPKSIPDAVKEALGNSPSLNAAVENVVAQRTAIDSRKAAYSPRLDFRYSANTDHNADYGAYGVTGRSHDYSAQVLLSFNIFRGGADKAHVEQAVAAHSQALDLQETACRDVRQTVAIAYNSMQRLNDQMVFLDQHRLSTEKAREAYRQQFEIGQRTLLDLLDTQNEYFEASRAYINARYDRVVAEARALAGIGKLESALEVGRADLPTPSDLGQERGGIDPATVCSPDAATLLVVDKEKAVADTPQRPRAVLPQPAVAPTSTNPASSAPPTAIAPAPLIVPARKK